MHNQDFSFSLFDAVRIALKFKKQIIIFTFLVAVCTAVYAYFLKNEYKSYANFYAASANIGSRTNMFRTENADVIDQFGFDAEQDRVYTIGNCSPLMQDLINKYDMYKHYEFDTSIDNKAAMKTFKKFAKNYKCNKGAYGNLELSVTDTDPVLASAIANDALTAIQDQYRSYYVKSHLGLAEALDVQIASTDSAIAKYTDSVIAVRNRYGVYDIVSPSRAMAGQGRSSNAEGIERVQNIEELKDKLVMDRARYESLKLEFKTIQHKSIPFIHVIQYPQPSGYKAAPFRMIMVLVASLLALVLGILLAVIAEYLVANKHRFQD
jgi:hypothetical protein